MPDGPDHPSTQRYIELVTQPALRAYDHEISERAARFRHDDKARVQHELMALRREFAWLYQDEALQGQVERLVEQWTRDFEANPNRALMCEAWASIFRDATWRDSWQISIGVALATRRERWERLAQHLGITVPKGFRAYRGVKGIAFVQAIVSAWQADAERLEVRQNELASWSLNPSVAYRFAEADAAAIYVADIPFEQTLADKWVDGSHFVAPYYRQYEVIAGKSTADGLLAQAKECRVFYRNKWYGYREREAVFERLRKR